MREDGTRRPLIRRLSACPTLCLAVPALFGLLLAVIPTALVGPPAPQIHDEWGYLMSADTFASGRWTNETHPLWTHFETFHQFHVPSYQSKYPPGQALSLAAGQAVGHPILGVWAGVALMLVSITWMLRAWVPPRWALVGGLLTACQMVVLGEPFWGGATGYWSQSYWGGALAAAGGAMLYGALARTLRNPGVGISVVMASGLLLMANTRPQEGLTVSLPAGVVLLVWLLRGRGPGAGAVLRRLILPVVLVLVGGFAAMGTYNAKVTGSALEMPWQTHYEQYCVFPVFVWQEPPPDRDWNHESLQVFHGESELLFHERHQSFLGFLDASVHKLARFWVFFVGLPLTLPLLFLPWVFRNRRMRFLAMPVALIVVVGLVTFSSLPHYSAPAAGLVVVLSVQCVRHLRVWRRHAQPSGRKLFAAVMVAAALSAAYGLWSSTVDVRRGRNVARHVVQRQLESEPGKHLVIVRYGPEHDANNEWVFNAADLDGTKVVWARETDAAGTAALLEHFADRHVWLMEVGFDPERRAPVPYPRDG